MTPRTTPPTPRAPAPPRAAPSASTPAVGARARIRPRRAAPAIAASVALASGCAGPAAAPGAEREPGTPPAAEAVEIAGAPSLYIDLLGLPGAEGIGEVRVRDPVTLTDVAACAASCAVPLVVGAPYEIIAAAPSLASIGGVCTGERRCAFTAARGRQRAKVRFAPDAAVGAQWTVRFAAPIRAAAFDGSGSLLAAGAALTKLSAAGAVLWTAPIAPLAVATGPGDSVYVHLGAEVRKLSAAGVTLWAAGIPPGALGCEPRAFGSCLAVGPAGEVVVRGATHVARWTADGALAWTRAVPSDPNAAVIVDGQGAVGATVESLGGERRDLVRLSAAGDALERVDGICAQYHAMLWLEGGAARCASSGSSWVYGMTAIRVPDPDFVPTGAASAGTWGTGWAFYEDDAPTTLTWQLRRYDAQLQLAWTQRGGILDLWIDAIGTAPLAVAGHASGQLALAGEDYQFSFAPGGFVTSYAPGAPAAATR